MTQAIIWKDDVAFPLNAAYLSRQLDVRAGAANSYAVVNGAGTGVAVLANTIIPLQSGATWKVYQFTTDSEITTLDTGALTLGVNYFAYLCDDGSDAGLLLLSANATAPSGYNATNSRKIIGFHYGRKRNSLTVADVTSGCVVPNSVWDLCHRPRCSPEGMVDLGNGVWVDAYLVSIDEAITFAAGNGSPLTAGTGKSAFNALPLTGTEGLSGYNFIELARRSGKRLLSHSEWLAAAHGSPQGADANNTNAWAATGNSVRKNCGYVVPAISLLNVVDCAGNVLEWLDEFVTGPDGAGGWQDVMAGLGVGQIWMYGATNLSQMCAGGNWPDGVHAGSRCVDSGNYYPWHVLPAVGCRLACDSL